MSEPKRNKSETRGGSCAPAPCSASLRGKKSMKPKHIYAAYASLKPHRGDLRIEANSAGKAARIAAKALRVPQSQVEVFDKGIVSPNAPAHRPARTPEG